VQKQQALAITALAMFPDLQYLRSAPPGHGSRSLSLRPEERPPPPSALRLPRTSVTWITPWLGACGCCSRSALLGYWSNSSVGQEANRVPVAQITSIQCNGRSSALPAHTPNDNRAHFDVISLLE